MLTSSKTSRGQAAHIFQRKDDDSKQTEPRHLVLMYKRTEQGSRLIMARQHQYIHDCSIGPTQSTIHVAKNLQAFQWALSDHHVSGLTASIIGNDPLHRLVLHVYSTECPYIINHSKGPTSSPMQRKRGGGCGKGTSGKPGTWLAWRRGRGRMWRNRPPGPLC